MPGCVTHAERLPGPRQSKVGMRTVPLARRRRRVRPRAMPARPRPDLQSPRLPAQPCLQNAPRAGRRGPPCTGRVGSRRRKKSATTTTTDCATCGRCWRFSTPCCASNRDTVGTSARSPASCSMARARACALVRTFTDNNLRKRPPRARLSLWAGLRAAGGGATQRARSRCRLRPAGRA